MDNQVNSILEKHNSLVKNKNINSNNITTIFTDCFNTLILRSISDDDLVWQWTQKVGQTFEIEPSIIYNSIKQIIQMMQVNTYNKQLSQSLYNAWLDAYICNATCENNS